ncbi:hypothetical protein FJ208_01455 [Candidatus Gribaldobacteria bacterium]|nr:hypothetical protein [Candidatus Gribaldobacteria bacterium]
MNRQKIFSHSLVVLTFIFNVIIIMGCGDEPSDITTSGGINQQGANETASGVIEQVIKTAMNEFYNGWVDGETKLRSERLKELYADQSLVKKAMDRIEFIHSPDNPNNTSVVETGFNFNYDQSTFSKDIALVKVYVGAKMTYVDSAGRSSTGTEGTDYFFTLKKQNGKWLITEEKKLGK